ncbi:MAG: hypothetical protein M3Z26_09235 [Bacteroidota bacterium]|nr:hypothetical protein [Bacteroidota bacterium]
MNYTLITNENDQIGHCRKDFINSSDTLIPDLSANWKNINDTQHDDEYNFLPPNTNVASSTFDGNETLDQGAGGQHSFSGSFQNSKINFTFNDGPKQGTKYTGKINGNAANATMTLTTPNGTITLQKHQ